MSGTFLTIFLSSAVIVLGDDNPVVAVNLGSLWRLVDTLTILFFKI